jgi:hypothetical protein
MHQSVQDAFIAFNTPLESRVPFMYLDSKSLVTTGIGNLLDADSRENFGTNAQLQPFAFNLGWFDKDSHANASPPEITQEYQTVKFSGTANKPLRPDREAITRLRIADAAIDPLVMTKLQEMEGVLQQRPEFANLQAWPADAQLGLFSMSWAMGPNFKFPNFQTAAAAGLWATMASECRISTAGLGPRNVRNELLFTIADWMAADPPGDFTVLVFDSSQSLEANMRAGTFPIPIHLDIGLQTALERLSKELGKPAFDPHGLDGSFGPGTRTALVAFQSDHALPQTPFASNVKDAGTATIDAIAAELDKLQIDHL